MRPQILYPLTFVLGLVSCNYVANKMSNDMLDSFKKVNASIEAGNAVTSAKNDSAITAMSEALKPEPTVYIYDINLHQAKDTALAAKGKAAYTAYRKMANYLDSLHDVLDTKDNTPKKDDKTPTQTLLLHTAAADRYKTAMDAFVNLYKTIPVSDSRKDSLKHILYTVEIHQESADWQSDYFKDQPTFATLTLLGGQKLMLEAGCRMVLADIDNRLK